MKLDVVNWNDRFEVKIMAKSGSSTQFRKVDVDQFDENNYQEEAVDDIGHQGPDESEVNKLLGLNKNTEALVYVLKNSPVGSKNQAIKEKAVHLVMRVLTSFKTSEVEKAVSAVGQDSESLDILMKYIYKGFEIPQEGSSALLLTWHEKVFVLGGNGSIVRVLADRKRV